MLSYPLIQNNIIDTVSLNDPPQVYNISERWLTSLFLILFLERVENLELRRMRLQEYE
jgi:hypothetical protein